MELSPEVRAAAGLLFGSTAGVDYQSLGEDRFRRAVRTHRAPLAAVDLDASLRRGLPPVVADVVSLEAQRLDSQRKGFSYVARAFAHAGVVFSLVKGAGYFPYTSDNVDVLVAEADLAAAGRSLTELGYREVVHLKEPYKWFFKALPERPLPPIHLHTEIAWINIFLDGQELLDRASVGDFGRACVYPSAEHVLLITLAHAVYEDKHLTLRDLFHVSRACSEGVDQNYARAVARRRGWERGWRLGLDLVMQAATELQLDGIAASISALESKRGGGRRSQMLFSSSKAYAKSLHVLKTWEDESTSPTQKVSQSLQLLRFAVLVKSGSLRRGGASLLISVSGQDGAGKTTVAESVVREMGPFAVRTSYRWMRLGSSRALEAMKSIQCLLPSTSPSAATGRDGEAKDRKELLERRPTIKKLWCWILVIDFLTRCWSRTLWARARGGVHVFDRGAADAEVDLLVRFGFPQHGIVRALAPKPDLAALLVVPPSVATARSATPVSEREALESDVAYSQLRAAFDLLCDARTSSSAIAQVITESALEVLQMKVTRRSWNRKSSKLLNDREGLVP